MPQGLEVWVRNATHSMKGTKSVLKFATWSVCNVLDSRSTTIIIINRSTTFVATEHYKYDIDNAAIQKTHLENLDKLTKPGEKETHYYGLEEQKDL